MNDRLPPSLASYGARVEEALRRRFPPRGDDDSAVARAMAYSLHAGGKRIRPILCLLACEATGGDVEALEPVAVSIEMIHTYSLIHDDLPCMDDDDLRRGRPSCHVAFGEAVALLAGDGLLTLGFAGIAGAGALHAERRTAIAAELAGAVGWEGMVGGQELDLAAQDGAPCGEAAVEKIHRMKTGVFLTAAVVCGALGAGASVETVDAFRRYGDDLGLAFQIADDLLDVVGSEETAGKRVGKDAARGKTTYPSLLGVDESRKRAQLLVRRAVDALPCDTEDRRLAALAEFVVRRIDSP